MKNITKNISTSCCYFTEHVLFPKEKKQHREKRSQRSLWETPPCRIRLRTCLRVENGTVSVFLDCDYYLQKSSSVALLGFNFYNRKQHSIVHPSLTAFMLLKYFNVH